MYESHFGLDGPPFQLNPDPAFYFDSRGHANALAYLRFGVHQAEGFIVVTGDVGAGKTTLVRTLLADVDPAQIVAAQIVSTQLEAGDLLRSIVAAFGIVLSGSSKAHLISTIEAFLTALATTKRRALLVVDEAQNLNPASVEELRMLSNFMLGSHALLQSFLVGQPDLRPMLASKSMEQFRQRVIASCHLGPLEPDECRGYVEHRLHRVGWKDLPRFEPECFEQIHRWTSGIPRRINLLCNRLLLSTFLGGRTNIAAADVDQTARELRAEVGEPGMEPRAPASVSEMPPKEARKRPAKPTDLAPPVMRCGSADSKQLRGCLMVVIDTPLGMAKAMTLASQVYKLSGVQSIVAVNPGIASQVALDLEVADRLTAPTLELHLNVPIDCFASTVAQLAPRFQASLEELEPRAVLTLGQSDGVLTCALVANKQGIPLLRLEAGRRGQPDDPRAMHNAALLDRISDILYSGDAAASLALHREGIPANRVHGTGSLIDSVLAAIVEHASPLNQILDRMGNPRASFPNGRSHVLVTLQLGSQVSPRVQQEIVVMLCALRRTAPIVWLVSEQTISAIEGDARQLRNAMIALASESGYLDTVSLLAGASCIVCDDDGRLLEEASALGIRSVMLSQQSRQPPVGHSNLTVRASSVEEALHQAAECADSQHGAEWGRQAPDEEPAARMAAHLGTWLSQQAKGAGRHLSLATVGR